MPPNSSRWRTSLLRDTQRNNVKWVTADLPFGRGGSRNSQAPSATDHGNNSYRGGGRTFGRRGSINGPMPTRGHGRNLNGDFRRPRQSNDENANNSVENTTAADATNSSQENAQKPVSVSAAAALSTANSRGSYQPRFRRGGTNRGASSGNRFPQPIPNPPIGVDGLGGAKIKAPLTAIHPSAHMPLFFPNPPVPLPPSLPQSVLIRARETAVLDNGIPPPMQQVNEGGLYVNTASANANVQSVPSVQSQSSPSRPVFTLEQFIEIVKSNVDAVIAPQVFKNNEIVKELLQPMQLPSGAINVNFPIDDSLVYIGEEIYLALNSTFSKIMKFHNRLDFINHHINHYFSEKNLKGDKFLYGLIAEKKGICPFSHLLQFKRLKIVNTDIADLVQCATPENNVEVTYDDANAPVGYRLLIPLPTEVLFDLTNADATSYPQSVTDIPNPPSNSSQTELQPLPINYPYHNYVPNVPAQPLPASFSTGAVYMDPNASGLNYHPESLGNNAYSGYVWGQNYPPPQSHVPYIPTLPTAGASAFPPTRFSLLPHLQYPTNGAPSSFVYIPSPFTVIGPRPATLNTGVVRPPVVPGSHPGTTENPPQDGNPDLSQ
nr:RNA binding protein Lupus La [Hymenolepis microstoma]